MNKEQEDNDVCVDNNIPVLDCEYYYPVKRLFFELHPQNIILWMKGQTKNGKMIGIWEEFNRDGSFKRHINYDRISN